VMKSYITLAWIDLGCIDPEIMTIAVAQSPFAIALLMKTIRIWNLEVSHISSRHSTTLTFDDVEKRVSSYRDQYLSKYTTPMDSFCLLLLECKRVLLEESASSLSSSSASSSSSSPHTVKRRLGLKYLRKGMGMYDYKLVMAKVFEYAGVQVDSKIQMLQRAAANLGHVRGSSHETAVATFKAPHAFFDHLQKIKNQEKSEVKTGQVSTYCPDHAKAVLRLKQSATKDLGGLMSFATLLSRQ
jgi:hypothetical protein